MFTWQYWEKVGWAVTMLFLAGLVWSRDGAGDASTAEGWIILFAGESWYRQQSGEERIFKGRLEAMQPEGVGFLMRTAFYKLGERKIYTAGRKVPALDARVGKEIEVRGKAVDLELEGQTICEIWPAAVRDITGNVAGGSEQVKPVSGGAGAR
ncbi:MAG: hypothetical protein ACUVWX_08240 [Kiritimatiellia bacterium]